MLTFARMAYLGTILFALFFLFLSSKSRAFIGGAFATAGDYMGKYAPYSYIILGILVLVPAIAALVLIKWPQAPEPENPMARYKTAQDVMED
jgi:hypothetical protein